MRLFERAPLDLRQCRVDLESGNGLWLLGIDPGGGPVIVDAPTMPNACIPSDGCMFQPGPATGWVAA